MISMLDLKRTIEKIDSVYYSLCNIDTLVRVEDTPAELYTCEKCIYRETVDEHNITCPHKVIAGRDGLIASWGIVIQ